MDALPVYQDVGGWLGLREDGRIVALDSETGRVFTADERWTLVGLVYAAKKHTTLASVLPPGHPMQARVISVMASVL